MIAFERAVGARLAYLEKGEGPAVVLVHGSLTDARYWQRSGQLDRLADEYRVVAPSRRHSFPNPLHADAGDYSAINDAADLLELIDALDLGTVHLLGHSYGAFAALLLTLRSPGSVRSLVLAEPPIMRWLPSLPRGQGVWERFEERVWGPIGAAFRDRGDKAGLDATARWYFGRAFDDIEPSWQQDFLDAAREWRALTTSRDAYPLLPLERLAEVAAPTLVLSAGSNAGGFNDVIDETLARLIPAAERIVVPNVSHEIFLDAPDAAASAVKAFFGSAP